MSMRHPRILLDCDGILADFVGGVLLAVRELTGRQLSPEDFPTWDVFDHLEVLLPDRSGLKKAVMNAVDEPGFCANLPAYPGVVDALRQLLELQAAKKLEFFVVTSPWHSPTWVYERDNWLMRRGVQKKNILHATTKHIIVGDMFVDDKAAHVRDWGEHHSPGGAFLWTTPHNLTEKNIRRLSGWEDFFAVLEGKVR